MARVPDVVPAAIGRHLTSAEHDRAKRFFHDADRRAYCVAHGLLHYALDQVTGCQSDRAIEVDAFGKPYLAKPHAGLHFNLSHTRQWVAVAVSPDAPVGVDIETDDHEALVDGMDEAWLSAAEKACVSNSRQSRLVWWVIKEALLKAQGCGLGQPPEQIVLPPVGLAPGQRGWCDALSLDVVREAAGAQSPPWLTALELPAIFGSAGPVQWPWCIYRGPQYWLGLCLQARTGARPDLQLMLARAGDAGFSHMALV